jgi:hypothetical protein
MEMQGSLQNSLLTAGYACVRGTPRANELAIDQAIDVPPIVIEAGAAYAAKRMITGEPCCTEENARTTDSLLLKAHKLHGSGANGASDALSGTTWNEFP